MIRIAGASDLKDTTTFMRPLPDAYVLTNAIREKEDTKSSKSKEGKAQSTCYSTAKTGIFLQSRNPQWNEDIRVAIVGTGYIVFNVFAQNTFSGDCFMGQCSVNLYDHPELYKDQPLALTLPIRKRQFPAYAVDGKQMTLQDTEGAGLLHVSLRVPSIYSNMVIYTS